MLVIIALIVIVLIVILLAVVKGGLTIATRQGDELRYAARPELFTAAERSFLGVLEQALGGEYRIFGKVRLGDLLAPVQGMTQSQIATARNRINQKHVDFVLCRPDTLAVVAVIELDDASHGRQDRGERDDFVDKVLSSAHLPVVHIPVRMAYTLAEVQTALAAVLPTLPTATTPPAPQVATEVPHPSPSAEEITAESVAEPIPTAAPDVEAPPNCPACNLPMVKRQAKQGAHAGQWFWACTGYPKCRKVLPVAEEK